MLYIAIICIKFVCYNGQCNGCSAGGTEGGVNCYNLINDGTIYACRGTFSGGMNDSSAKSICGDGYHICSSANETSYLGLTEGLCGSTITSYEVYLTEETSDGSNKCDSVYGDSTPYRDDVWGCGANSNICGNTYSCLNLNFVCANTNKYDSHGNLIVGGLEVDTQNEWYHISLYNSSYGGVLCCRDPTSSPTFLPTNIPSILPTPLPTESPTLPSKEPSSQPTVEPNAQPSSPPSSAPNRNPTGIPSDFPSSEPTKNRDDSSNGGSGVLDTITSDGATLAVFLMLLSLLCCFVCLFVVILAFIWKKYNQGKENEKENDATINHSDSRNPSNQQLELGNVHVKSNSFGQQNMGTIKLAQDAPDSTQPQTRQVIVTQHGATDGDDGIDVVFSMDVDVNTSGGKHEAGIGINNLTHGSNLPLKQEGEGGAEGGDGNNCDAENNWSHWTKKELCNWLQHQLLDTYGSREDDDKEQIQMLMQKFQNAGITVDLVKKCKVTQNWQALQYTLLHDKSEREKFAGVFLALQLACDSLP